MQLFLYLNSEFDMGTNNIRIKESARSEEKRRFNFGRLRTILECSKYNLLFSRSLNPVRGSNITRSVLTISRWLLVMLNL